MSPHHDFLQAVRSDNVVLYGQLMALLRRYQASRWVMVFLWNGTLLMSDPHCQKGPNFQSNVGGGTCIYAPSKIHRGLQRLPPLWLSNRAGSAPLWASCHDALEDCGRGRAVRICEDRRACMSGEPRHVPTWQDIPSFIHLPITNHTTILHIPMPIDECSRVFYVTLTNSYDFLDVSGRFDGRPVGSYLDYVPNRLGR